MAATARALARSPAQLPAHAVGHQKQMCALLANLQLRFRQTRLPDPHCFGELGNEELILIGCAHLSFVGDSKGLHRQRAGTRRRDGLVGHGISVRSGGTVPSLKPVDPF